MLRWRWSATTMCRCRADYHKTFPTSPTVCSTVMKSWKSSINFNPNIYFSWFTELFIY
jgi:hypothetical protein